MALKISTYFYSLFQFLGRFFYAFINLTSVIFFSRFADKSLSIEENNDSENNSLRNKIGNNFSPWPEQALHIFENTKEVDDEFLNRMFVAHNKSNEDLKKTNFKDSRWKELRSEFNTIFIEDKKVNKKNIINFRNDIDSKAAILKDQNIAISNKNSKTKNMFNAIFLVCLYHKYSEVVDLSILRSVSDSFAGNNRCINYRGQRLNHRILRYTYYLSQLKNNLDFKRDQKFSICDIGGGYGGLLRLLKHYYKNSCCILVELPETCLLASYFIKKIFLIKKFYFIPMMLKTI